jgi:capsular exopolysaccharide synthesis family protein
VELLEYVRIAKRRWLVLVVGLVLGAAAGLLTAPSGSKAATSSPAGFTARATLALNPDAARTASTGNNSAGLTINAMAFYATTGEVPRRAAKELNYEGDPAVLATLVTATADEKLNTIQLVVKLNDGKRAADIANSFATSLMTYLDDRAQSNQQQQLQVLSARSDSLQKQIADLTGQIGGGGPGTELLKAQRDALVRQYGVAYERVQQITGQGVATAGLSLLEKASPIPGSSGVLTPPTGKVPRTALAGILGFMLAAGAALMFERLDTRLRSRGDVEDAFMRPVLSEVALTRDSSRTLVTVSAPSSHAAEAYRTLRTALVVGRHRVADAFANGNGNGNGSAADRRLVVLVTSVHPDEGKATVAANLAAAFAERDQAVLLVSADIMRPEVENYFGGPGKLGLSDVIRPDGPALSDVLRQTSIGGLTLLPSGRSPEGFGRLAGSVSRVLASARNHVEVVVIDAPPVLVAHDAGELVPEVDAVVVVCRAGRTSADDARRATQVLDRLGARFDGVVLASPTAWTGKVAWPSAVPTPAPAPTPTAPTPPALEAEPADVTPRVLAEAQAVYDDGSTLDVPTFDTLTEFAPEASEAEFTES